MRMDKLTSKFQMALGDAQSLAVGRDHQFIEPVHLMVALLDQQGGTVRHSAGSCVPERLAHRVWKHPDGAGLHGAVAECRHGGRNRN